MLFDLQVLGVSARRAMASSLVWVLIGVYVGFFIFLQKVMKD